MEPQQSVTFDLSQAKPVPPPPPEKKPKAAVTFDLSDAKPVAQPSPTAPDVGSGDEDPLSMHSLASDNSDNEGLYHMKDDEGHSFAIPFSKVELVNDFRNHFDTEDEARKYEKDFKETKPGLWGQLRTKVYDVTEPTLDYQRKGKDFDGGVAASAEMQNNVLKRVGRTLFGIPDMVPQVYQSLKKMASDDPKISAEGEDEINNLHPGSQIAERMKEFKHDYKKDPQLAFANTAGDALAFYVADKMGEAVHGAPTKVRAKTGEMLRRTVGTDARATEAAIRDVQTKNKKAALKAEEEGRPAHAEAARKIIEKNEADKIEHDKNVEAIRAENEAKLKEYEDASAGRSETEKKRVELSREAAELKSRLHPKDAPSRLQIIQNGAKAYFDRQYNQLSKLVGERRGDAAELAEHLDKAEEKIQGSDTRIQVFEDIKKRLKGEASSAEPPDNWREMTPDEREDWRKESAGKGGGITYDDLRGYFRELGKLIGSDATPGDVKTAAGTLRDGLEEMQSKLAKEAGVKADNLHNNLRAEYRDYAETMLDKSSPVTKMLNAPDADTALKVFDNMTPFQKSYALNLMRGTGEFSDWLRRTDRAEAGVEGKIQTPAEVASDKLVTDAADAVKKAQDTWEKAAPGHEKEGAAKTLARTQSELETAKAKAAKSRPGESKRLRNMRNYREDTAKLVDNYLRKNDDLDRLGKPKAPPEPPKLKDEPVFKPKEVPEFEPPKPETISKENLAIRKEEAVNDYLDKLRKNYWKFGISGIGTIGVAEILGHTIDHLTGMGAGATETIAAGLAAVQILGPGTLMKIVKMPGVLRSLMTITKAEVEAIEKMAPAKRVAVDTAIVNMTQLAKSQGMVKPSEPTPMAKWAKADMAKAKAAEAAKPEPPPEEEPPASTPEPEPETPPAAPAAAEATPEPAKEPEPTPQPEVAPTPKQNTIPSRRLDDLKVDAKRFQYKLGGNKAGVTDALSDAKWDQSLADPIHIWEDPETGEEFVVNGHHRYELAQQAGAERINVSPIDNTVIKTAAEAREYGAMKNIADGNGTAVDAAKFFRDKGLTPADLKKRGLSLKKSVANEGVALSRLSDDLFHRVVDGRLDPKIGAAIGDATDSAADQEAILKDVNRREKQGRPATPEQIRESARLIKAAPSYTQTTGDLFGTHEETRNLFLEMGEVSEYIQRELADEKAEFRRLSTKSAAERLAKGNNVISPEENAKIAKQAALHRALYDKLSSNPNDPVHHVLEEAARNLADEGAKSNEIKQEAFDEIRQLLGEHKLGKVD